MNRQIFYLLSILSSWILSLVHHIGKLIWWNCQNFKNVFLIFVVDLIFLQNKQLDFCPSGSSWKTFYLNEITIIFEIGCLDWTSDGPVSRSSTSSNENPRNAFIKFFKTIDWIYLKNVPLSNRSICGIYSKTYCKKNHCIFNFGIRKKMQKLAKVLSVH